MIEENLFWGGSLAFWIQTFVFAFSAFIAVWTISKNERQARRRATIDLVLHEMRDEQFRAFREQFALMRDSNEQFTALACKKYNELSDEEKNKREAIIALLSHYEFIATGVFEKALDEKIYKKMKKSLVVKDWESLEVYVAELRKREGRPQLFTEIEALAKKWQKRNLVERLKDKS